MMLWLAGFVACLLSVSTAFAQESPQALQDAFVKAMTSNDIDGMVALYAPDATLYPPDAMVARR